MKQLALTLTLVSLLLGSLNAQNQAQGKLTVTLTTSKANGSYAPRNIVAIWVEDKDGNFVKTLLINAKKRITHLNTWQTSTSKVGSDFNQVDAISGATNATHSTKTCTWDGTDYTGTLVKDAEYQLHVELTDKNSTGNHSYFTFTKGPSSDIQTPNNVPSFSNINLNWEATVLSINKAREDDLKALFYPNPGKGIYTLINEKIIATEIVNIEGKTIYKGTNQTIDISEHPNGLYFICLTKKDGVDIQGLVKH